jgi:carotenoid cleavage dioxygenase-like enzyme
MPEWLRGDLVRVAPAFGATPNWAPAHWFDALGLAFGFVLDGGERVDLRWAAFECEMATAAASGKVDLAQFASPNQRGALTRLFQPIPVITDNANVNVQRMGDDLIAMTETPHQLLLDPRTEERYVFGSTLRGDAGSVRSDIVRIDVQSGTAQRFAEGDYVFGEPVFVGAPGRSREGDGVLLAVGSSERGSGLFVLDATTLDVLARAEFEVPLPLGFHGSFTPAANA